MHRHLATPPEKNCCNSCIILVVIEQKAPFFRFSTVEELPREALESIELTMASVELISNYYLDTDGAINYREILSDLPRAFFFFFPPSSPPSFIFLFFLPFNSFLHAKVKCRFSVGV